MQQFVENTEHEAGWQKILRVIHAPSDLMPQLPFATEHLVLQETRSLTHCKEEDNSMIGLLRWNDFSTVDAVQWWRLVPHGFGVFFDVLAGSQWIIIAAPASLPLHPNFFATSDLYINIFMETEAINPTLIRPEAILLTAGMQM